MKCPVLVKILVNEEVKDHTEDKEDVKIRFFFNEIETNSFLEKFTCGMVYLVLCEL